MTEQEIAALVERNRQLEADLARVTTNRDSLLREKKALEHRRAPDPVLDETARLLRLADRATRISDGTERFGTVSQVTVQRGCAHAEYVEAKARAEKFGVPLVVVDGHVDPALASNARGAPSTVKYVEDEKTFWAHQEMQREVGIIELDRRAKAAGKALRIFKSADDLDPEARSKHDRIVAEADPDQLLFEGE